MQLNFCIRRNPEWNGLTLGAIVPSSAHIKVMREPYFYADLIEYFSSCPRCDLDQIFSVVAEKQP